jgi:hypothetical protein
MVVVMDHVDFCCGAALVRGEEQLVKEAARLFDPSHGFRQP